MYSIATRTAGLLVPLFALRSERDWGIGEIGDLAAYCQWLGSAGHRFLQLLPIFEMPAGERSPYGALSTFAVDPIHLSLGEVEDFLEAGGEAMLPGPERAALDAARVETGIDYDRVRTVKRRALEIAFARFDLREWSTGSSRAARLRDFAAAEADWLADYALFRACQERQAGASWTEWEPALRSRAPEVLAHARQTFDRDLRFHTYVQWLASEQWTAARRAASAAGVALAGDLPFMVGRESADVWSRQEEFQLDTELGAPPDAFNAEGQRWGLPVPRWETMARGDFRWLRARSRRAAALFDAVRIDHVVGFYRIYRFPTTGAPEFVPPDEGDQLALGERLLTVALASAAGTALMGEDLGVVPDFVRASLVRLAIPGYRVLRWEDDAGVFRDPSAALGRDEWHARHVLPGDLVERGARSGGSAGAGGRAGIRGPARRGRDLHACGACGPPRWPVRSGIIPRHGPGAGCLRRARTDQRPRHGRATQLGLPLALDGARARRSRDGRPP